MTVTLRLCQFLRVRGRWKSIAISFIYYLTAVVLIENVLIAWSSASRFRSATMPLTAVTSADETDVLLNASLNHSAIFGAVRSLASTTTLTLATPSTSTPQQLSKRIPPQQLAFYARRATKINRFPYNYLRVPPGLCHNDTQIVVLIHSHPKYGERREAIRKTWVSAVKTGEWPNNPVDHSDTVNATSRFIRTCCQHFQMAFVIGQHRDEGVNDMIDEEYLNHWDIIQGNFLDDYQNMTLKSLLGLKFVMERCPRAKYMLKTDDDMVINLPRLVHVLDDIAADHKRFAVGPRNVGSRVYRTGKWKLSKEQFPFDVYPPYLSGSAYVISGDVIGELFETAEYVPWIFIDDVYITGILGQIVGVKLYTCPGFAFWTSRPPTACDLITGRVVTGTKMTPNNLYMLWKQLQNGPVCPVLPTVHK